MKAQDLIDLDVSNIEQEKRRVSGLLVLLAKESGETKCRIANELIEIVVNPHERIARRSQAAFLLGTSSKSLEIRGSSKVSEALVGTLDAEFLGAAQGSMDIGRNYRKEAIEVDGLRLVFLQGLVFSIVVIKPALRGAVAKRLYDLVNDAQLREWLQKVTNIAPLSD